MARYGTELLHTVGDVPTPPDEPRLKASGLTVVGYSLLRLSKPREWDPVRGDAAYVKKLHDDAGLTYSKLRPSGPLPAPISAAVGAEGFARCAFVTFGHEYVLVVHPLVFACHPGREKGVRLSGPLELPQMLKLVEAVTDRDILEALTNAACEAASLRDVEGRTVLEGRAAVQLWDLTGSLQSPPDAPTARGAVPYEGVKETKGYCWELSALMAHASDHVVKADKWRERSPDAVLAEARHGFTFLSDHFVLLNETCCLEVTHTAAAPATVFLDRLAGYGYDSTSIFIWTLAALREGVLRDLEARYRQDVARFAKPTTRVSPQEQERFARRSAEDEVLVSRLDGLGSLLREPRNREFEAEVALLHHHDRANAAVASQIARASALVSELEHTSQEARRSHTNVLLAALGIGVALSGIPQGVGQVGDWIDDNDWTELVIAGVLLILLVVVTGALLLRGDRPPTSDR
jgi:hypothetical protein